jgi:RNA polymerase sigma-B factor
MSDLTAAKPTPRRHVAWGRSEERLLARAQRDGDRAAMEELVRRMMPLARRLARKYHAPRDQFDDLVQVASLALFRALQRFDPDRGVKFPSYAIPVISGELKRYRRDFSWTVRPPRPLQERALLVRREHNFLAARLGRTPTDAELGARCDLSVEEVREGQLAAAAHESVSLDAPADDLQVGPRRTVASDDGHFRLVEEADALRPALRVLPKRERQIVALRFGEDLSQNEIAHRVGISQMHVSRLLRGALDRMQPILARSL